MEIAPGATPGRENLGNSGRNSAPSEIRRPAGNAAGRFPESPALRSWSRRSLSLVQSPGHEIGGESVVFEPLGKRREVVFIPEKLGQFGQSRIRRDQAFGHESERAEIGLQCLARIVEILCRPQWSSFRQRLRTCLSSFFSPTRDPLRERLRRQFLQVLAGGGDAFDAPGNRLRRRAAGGRVGLLFEQGTDGGGGRGILRPTRLCSRC